MNFSRFFLLIISIQYSLIGVSQVNILQETEALTFNNFDLDLTYGLSDFCYPIKNYGINYVPLVILFKSGHQFVSSSGKGYRGEYKTFNPNQIRFGPTETTLQCVTISINGGIEFCPFLFMDSLLICNNYRKSDNEIRFYKNKEFKIALKPYHDLLPFPSRNNCISKYIKEVKVSNVTTNAEFTLIDSETAQRSMNVKIIEDSVDFNKQNLIIIKKHSLLENKTKEFRKIIKQYKSQIRNNENGEELYPISYVKIRTDSTFGHNYLDIVNTYFKSNSFDINRRGEYSAFLVDKNDLEEYKLEIKYVE